MILNDTYASYLNLSHRQDRRHRMWKTLSVAGIDATRTPGGQKWTGDPKHVQKMMEGSTPSTVECYVGQLSIMREALRRNQHALVMEDDLVVCSDFQDRMKIIEEFLVENPWDVFWLGGTYHVNPPVWHKDAGPRRDVELTENPRIVRTYGCWSTYAYLVNRESLQKILDLHLKNLPESVGIDTTFIHLQPFLRTYAFVPGCVKQYDGFSDISHAVSKFSGFESLGPYWWQDRMEDFDPRTFDWAEAK